MGPFVFVRHARPHRDAALPPAAWSLEPEGVAALRALANTLQGCDLTLLRTSAEPKAVQTGRVLSDLLHVPAVADPRLNEVRREPVEQDAEFTESVRSYLEGATIPAWEQQDSVLKRVQVGVDDACDHAPGLVGIISHGTAMSLYLQNAGLASGWEFWRQLMTPDAWFVDQRTMRRL